MVGQAGRSRRTAALLAPAALVCALVAGPGCGPSSAELKKELASLRTEITSLRASTAAMSERLDALEMGSGGLRTPGAPAPQETGQVDEAAPPDLPVVRLGPDTPPPPDEPAARVKIRSTPGGLVQEEVKGEDANGPAKPAPKKEPPKPPAKPPSKPPAPKPSPAPAPPKGVQP